MATKNLVGKLASSRTHGCRFQQRQGTRFFSKKRKSSSHRWHERHVSDPFVKKAQAENRVSRSYFKIEQIDDKYDIIQKNQTVIDLGASPGGWTSFAASKGAHVVAIDLLEMDKKISKLQNVNFIRGDFSKLCYELKEFLHSDGHKGRVCAVISDIAPNFTGHQRTDAIRTADLCEQALEFSIEILQPSGSFVGKLFSGPEEQHLKKIARDNFTKVAIVKPRASRSDSSERYIVAKGFKQSDRMKT
mmetsp:Transcript_22040/g.32563  ORF Transcript_22040/g.32563 Transcript_22040/m.32563 type:complete len:246 (+) Transcript_22040:43-780(+)